MDLSDVGFGHQEDQFLSPRLIKYASLDKNYQPNAQEEVPTYIDSKPKNKSTISYGKHEYNFMEYLNDEESDEEEQKDFQIE